MWFSLPAKLNDTFEFSVPIFIPMSAVQLVESYEKRFKIDYVAPELLDAMMSHSGSQSFPISQEFIQGFLSTNEDNRSLFTIAIVHFLREQGLTSQEIATRLNLDKDSELRKRLESELREAYERNQSVGSHLGVLSLSARNDDPLMWAHYADSCRGICMVRIYLTKDANAATLEIDDPQPGWLSMLEALSSWGATDIVFVEAYFDESGTHHASHVLCVAGYAMEAPQARLFEREWRELLGRYQLPYFHMSECAHGTVAFKHLSMAERIEVETRAIGIIKRRVRRAFAVTIDETEYMRLFDDPVSLEALGEPYTWCLRMCLTEVGKWCQRYPDVEKVSYIFESGHASQTQANRILTETNAVPITRENRRYLSHSFVGKKDACGLQAADLLAWQWAKNFKRIAERKSSRLDFVSLVRGVPANTGNFDAALLQNLKSFVEFRKTEAGKGDDFDTVMAAWQRSRLSSPYGRVKA